MVGAQSEEYPALQCLGNLLFLKRRSCLHNLQVFIVDPEEIIKLFTWPKIVQKTGQ